MRKTKSLLKLLLIVLLAVMLVVSLVACNKKPAGPVTVDITTEDYFGDLWNATAPIGQTAIASDADIALAFGAEIALNTRDSEANDMPIVQQIDFGVDIQAVIGRTAATQNNTALKVRFYDPTDSENTEIVTLYAFANDIDNLYVDFAGKNMKFPHGLAKLIWNDLLGNTTQLKDNIYSGLTNKFMQLGAEKKSVNDIINFFVGSFGPNWTLNSLFGGIFDLFDLDIVNLLDNLDFNGIKLGPAIYNILGVANGNELLDENGKFNIYQVLTNENIGQFFNCQKTTNGDKISHVAAINDELMNVIGLAVASLPKIFGEGGGLSFGFSQTGEKLNDFSIKAVFGGLLSEVVDNQGTSKKVVPEIEIKVNKLRIENLTTENGIALQEGKTYSENIAINETLELEATGIKIEPIDGLNTEPLYLNGKFIVSMQGKLDIVNIENNQTQVAVKVDLVNGNEPAVRIADGSLANGKIAIKLATALEDGTKGYVYDLGINVAEWAQTQIKDMITSMFPKDDGGNNGNGVVSAEGSVDIMGMINGFLDKLYGAAGHVLALFKTNNNIEISTDNILATVVSIKEAIYREDWTEENRKEAIVKSLVNPKFADKTLDECFNLIMEELTKLMPKEDNSGATSDDTPSQGPNPPVVAPPVTWDDIKGNVGDALIRILYILASRLRIDGVASTNLNAADYVKYQSGETPLTEEQMIYANHILAALASKITIKGDLQKGIHGSIEIKLANATLAVRSSLDLVEITESTFTDIYAQNQAEIESANSPWVNLKKTVA